MLESEMPGSDLAEELVGSAIGTAGTLKGALENYASVKASGDATEISAAKAIVMNQVGGSESIATMTALAIQGMREDEYLQPEQSYACNLQRLTFLSIVRCHQIDFKMVSICSDPGSVEQSSLEETIKTCAFKPCSNRSYLHLGNTEQPASLDQRVLEPIHRHLATSC